MRELKKRACPSCGAPLTPMPGGGGYTCPFCDTVLHWEETEPPVQDAKKRPPAPFVPPKPTVDPRKDWLADFQRADREVTIFPPTDPLRVSKRVPCALTQGEAAQAVCDYCKRVEGAPFWTRRPQRVLSHLEQVWFPVWCADATAEGAIAAVSSTGLSAEIHRGELTLLGKQFADLQGMEERLLWQRFAPFPLDRAKEGDPVKVARCPSDLKRSALLAGSEAKDRLYSTLFQENHCKEEQKVQYKASLLSCSADCVLYPVWKCSLPGRGKGSVVWVDGVSGRTAGSVEAGFFSSMLAPAPWVVGLIAGGLATFLGVLIW